MIITKVFWILNCNRDYFKGARGVSKGINLSRIINDYLRIKPFNKFKIRLGYVQASLLTFAIIVKTSSKPVLVDKHWSNSI